ncbi:hypothetical protein [Chryseobacterium nakagawai]|uniref:hypothetical protein n=1 Tax=Chryseobacterium nakagawai TaxID=1241982 RepID=UPI0013DE1689|nr:hypothetical protein [Chryseobacterium nakagawai]
MLCKSCCGVAVSIGAKDMGHYKYPNNIIHNAYYSIETGFSPFRNKKNGLALAKT